MNNILKQVWLLCLLLVVVSCNKDPEYYTLETPVDQMALKTSSADVVLGKDKEKEIAVTFTWNEAANREAGADITYYFKMWMVELSSNVTQLYEVQSGERSISFTHGELNDILAGWGMSPGDKVTVEAEVIAQTNSTVQYFKPELSKTRLNVVGYDKNATAIYLVMLMENGERTTRRMTEKFIGSGVYQSTVDLAPCKYYFTMSPESEYPAYMKGETDNTLKYVSEEGDYEMLENTRTGSYTLVVDVNQLDVNMVQLYALPQGGIWIVGKSCPTINWDVNNSLAKGGMKANDPRHPEIWTYTGEFIASNNNANQFKLMLEGSFNSDKKFFFAPSQGADPGEVHTLLAARTQNEGGDVKWSVPIGGIYTLIVNIDVAQMSIDLVPAK